MNFRYFMKNYLTKADIWLDLSGIWWLPRRFCRLSIRHQGVLGIGGLVVSLFRRCITFWKDCNLCNRWHWLRYSWNDQWYWWIVWVPIITQRCEWKNMIWIVRVRIWKFRVDHLFGMHFWLKIGLWFCRVWMKLREVAKRFCQYQDHLILK